MKAELYRDDGSGCYPTLGTCREDIVQALEMMHDKKGFKQKVAKLDESQMYKIIQKTADIITENYYWSILADTAVYYGNIKVKK